MKKLIFVLTAIILLQISLNAQKSNDSIKTALLIVDIQNFYFPGERPGLVNF